jgi:hypothetical protein
VLAARNARMGGPHMTKQRRLGRPRAVRLATITAAVLSGCGLLASSASPGMAAPGLHTPQWLEHHCPIWVYANILTGYPDGEKQGLSLRAKWIQPNTLADPMTYSYIRFTWHVPAQDQFCGIVGPFYRGDKTLTPTTETATGGTYIDTTQNKEISAEQMDGLFVFVRRAT